MLHEFRIEKRETHKLRLIQIHHEQFVRGSQIRLLRGELLVKVAHVLAMFLRNKSRSTSPLSCKKKKKDTHDFRLERWLHLPILYLLPIDTSEKRVAPHVLLPS